MLESLLSLLALVMILLAAYALGRPVIVWMGVDARDRLAVHVWSLAVGLVIAGQLLTLLGLLGWLYRAPIGILTVTGACWGLGLLCFSDRNQRSKSAKQEPAEEASPSLAIRLPGWVGWPLLAAVASVTLGSLVSALAPPTAGDALCYHLELPKRFLAEHRLAYLPDSDNSTYPLLVELWFLWGLALRGAVTAQLVHWALGPLVALATALLARRIVGTHAAWLAAGLVMLVPGVNNQMTAPLIDLGLAALTTLGLVAWREAARSEGGQRWYLLTGVMWGAALAAKYLALLFLAAVAAVTLWGVVRDRLDRRETLRGALAAAAVALAVGGVWYVRAYWHTGNPVYPFFSNKSVAESANDPGPSAAGALAAPLRFVAAGWTATMHPEAHGGRGHRLGVVFLATVPLLLVARRLHGLGGLLAVAGVYWLLWSATRQNLRFLLPVVPLLAVAATWCLVELRRFPRGPRLLACGSLAAAVAAAALVPLLRARESWPVAVGLETRHDYLLEHEPSYAVALSADGLPDGARVLSQDYRSFYFHCAVTRESIYRRRTGYDRLAGDPARLRRHLQSAGFTHLLLAEAEGSGGIRYDSTLSRLADGPLSGSLRCLREHRFVDADGAVRRYRLMAWRLTEPPSAN